MKIIPASDPIVGWRVWSLFSPIPKLNDQEDNESYPSAESTQETDLGCPRLVLSSLRRNPNWGVWPPRRAKRAECHECFPPPNSGCSCGIHAFREYIFPEDIPRPNYGIDVPRVYGRVVGWGGIVEDEDTWRTTYSYPLSIALICTGCLMMNDILRPATHVFVVYASRPWVRVVCEVHSLRIICEEKYARGDRLLPAREVEARLMAQYGVGRTNLALVEDDPGLFLAEMGITESC